MLDEATAAAVESRLARWLEPDPHTDAAAGTYGVTSIYCDTPTWNVYFREGEHGTRKYRVRRYGQDGPVYLERKSVRKSMVRKHRSPVNISDFASLIENDSHPQASWFVRQVTRAGLRPACRISYERRALFGSCTDGPMRITFDRHIRGHTTSEWNFNGATTGRPLLDGVIICEFKFRDAMPAPMKEAVGTLNLTPRGVSKYRACIRAFADALGVAARGDTHA